MLLLADLSGIQDYLFDVQEEGGKQAAALRARSLRIQLYAQVFAARVLRAANLNSDRLVFCAAGKVLIDGSGLTPDHCESVRQEAVQVEDILLKETHGRLRLAWVLDTTEAGITPAQLKMANETLARKKLQAWRGANGDWRDRSLVIPAVLDRGREADWDADLGRNVVAAAHVGVRRPDGALEPSVDRVLDLKLDFGPADDFAASDTAWSAPLDRLARHIPRHADKRLVEFVDLARRSRGAAMLGVLKADADSLGQVIASRLTGAADLRPWQTLAEQLDAFFGRQIGEGMHRDGSPWRDLYTVFAGGDDLLVVGPWSTVLDFAGWVHTAFSQRFNSDRLTLSAGMALCKPKFPIRLAVQQADELLDQAKGEKALGASEPKDQFAALGQCWKWQDHDGIVNAGKQLADWVDNGIIQRGWIHTLLELTLSRRAEPLNLDAKNKSPAMATPRLSYHIGRLWPRRNDRNPVKAAARCWADGILDGFDLTVPNAPTPVKYLPAILRYAMLATRSSDAGEFK